jgi:O-antigen ligase
MEMTLEVVLIVLVALPIAVLAVTRPTGTILPIYAALVPIGGVFALPLPFPFNSITSVVGALAIGAIAAHLLLYRRGRIPTMPVAMWLLFVGWSALTVAWAIDQPDALGELVMAMPLVLLVLLAALVPIGPGDIRWLRTSIALGGAAIGAYALTLVVSGAALPVHGAAERFSLAGDPAASNPNQLAAALLLPMLAALDMVVDPTRGKSRRAERAFGLVATWLTAIAIVLSGSRGGVMAALAALVLALLLYHRWRPTLRPTVRSTVAVGGAVVTTLLAVATMLVVFFPDARATSIVISDPVRRLATSETGASGREEIWAVAMLACRQHCGVGAGLGGFPSAYDEALPFSGVHRNVGSDRPAHNVYLEIAVETGLIGVVLFALAIAAEWRVLRRGSQRALAPALAAAIVGMLAVDLFEGFLWFKHVWLLFVVLRVFEGTGVDGTRSLEPRDEAGSRLQPATQLSAKVSVAT